MIFHQRKDCNQKIWMHFPEENKSVTIFSSIDVKMFDLNTMRFEIYFVAKNVS
jgi:hypothetical protein